MQINFKSVICFICYLPLLALQGAWFAFGGCLMIIVTLPTMALLDWILLDSYFLHTYEEGFIGGIIYGTIGLFAVGGIIACLGLFSILHDDKL